MGFGLIMRWLNESKRPMDYFKDIPCIHAKDIVYSAYREGFINWNTFIEALRKINTAMNGSWMFEQRQEKCKN